MLVNRLCAGIFFEVVGPVFSTVSMGAGASVVAADRLSCGSVICSGALGRPWGIVVVRSPLAICARSWGIVVVVHSPLAICTTFCNGALLELVEAEATAISWLGGAGSILA
jgi:hypothetical protein